MSHNFQSTKYIKLTNDIKTFPDAQSQIKELVLTSTENGETIVKINLSPTFLIINSSQTVHKTQKKKKPITKI